jgi:transposase
MLLTHGAGSGQHAVAAVTTIGHEVSGLRRWALDVQGLSNHNKATCALANKLARICFATLRDKQPFGEAHSLDKKITRGSFAMPA